MLVGLRGDLQDAPDDSLTTIVGDLGLTTDLDYVVYGIDNFDGTKSFGGGEVLFAAPLWLGIGAAVYVIAVIVWATVGWFGQRDRKRDEFE